MRHFSSAVFLLFLCCLAVSVGHAAPKGEGSSGWKTKTFAQPNVGLSTFTSDGTTSSMVSLGGTAGLRYWQKGNPTPTWRGTFRGQAAYLVGAGSGMEVRVGNFIGPWWKMIGVSVGPDLFWNQYTWGSVTLEPTTGVGLPVMTTVGVKQFSVFGGVEPAWYISSERDPVDWSETDAFGFGHEFSKTAGVSLNLPLFRVGVYVTERTTSLGKQVGYGLSLKL